MNFPKLLTALLGAALVPSVVAASDGGPTADVTLEQVTLIGDSIDVAGTFEFGGSVEVAVDPAGDAMAPGGGVDLASLTYEQVGNRLRAELRLHDATPFAGVSELTRYAIPIPSSELPNAEMHAWSSSALNTVNGEADPGEVFTSIDYLEGGYFWSIPVEGGLLTDGSGLFWDFSLGEAQLSRGADLAFPAAASEVGAAGFFKGGTLFTQDSMRGSESFAVAGQLDVTLLDSTGREVAEGKAVADSGGHFETTVGIAGLGSGTYTLTVTGAYATTEDMASATVSLG